MKKIGERKLDYSWVMIALCFIMVFIVLGFCSSAKSIYISPICDALGISRSAYSLNETFRYITTSVVNVFFGSLIMRFGTKKLIISGFLSLIVCMFIYSFATNVFMFYLGAVFMGIGFSFTTTTMVGAVVNKWCTENRGTITGFILAANGVGAALAMQILSPIINNPEDIFGYRASYRLVAIILAAVTFFMILLFRENPPKKSFSTTVPKKEDTKKKSKIDNNWQGIPLSIALRRWYFYAMALCIFFIGMVLQGIFGISAPHLKDVGLSSEYVAWVLSFNSILLTCSKFMTGFLYDRFGLRLTSGFCLVSAIAVTVIMLNINPTPEGKTFAFVYAVLVAIALPLETVMLSIFVNDLFGHADFNKILGIYASVTTVGFALGAPCANLCYDILGNYNVVFYTSMIIISGVTILIQFIITSAHKERKKVL